MTINKKTDWDAYYKKPASYASFTRKITENSLIRIFKQYVNNRAPLICELGGANSCFFTSIKYAFPQSSYLVVDSNQYGVDLFTLSHSSDLSSRALCLDLLKASDKLMSVNSDLVFSVGLIEHFTKRDTALVIQEHFNACNKDGVVVITFPTPTLLYRFCRKCAELAGIWIFFDERPLLFNEVISTVEQYGEVLEKFINWGVILTQGIVVARKKL